jgi:hypothetical protein
MGQHTFIWKKVHFGVKAVGLAFDLILKPRSCLLGLEGLIFEFEAFLKPAVLAEAENKASRLRSLILKPEPEPGFEALLRLRSLSSKPEPG